MAKSALIAEDDAELRKLFVDYLIDMGYEVVYTAENGIEGFNHIKEKTDISLVITDINMSGSSDFEELKNGPAMIHKALNCPKISKNIKYLVLTGIEPRKAYKDEMEKIARLGFPEESVFYKPVSFDALQKAAETAPTGLELVANQSKYSAKPADY